MESSSIERRLNALEVMLDIQCNRVREGKSSAASKGDDSSGSADDITTNNDAGDDRNNVQARIDALFESTVSQLRRHQHLESKLDEIDELGNELCPSGLFLHSTNTTGGPSAICGTYRKQEILVRYDELTDAFEMLEKIRDLLSISNPPLAKKLQVANGSTGVDKGEGLLDDVISAPILASSSFAFAADPHNRKRLNDLTNEVLTIREKSLSLSKRLDEMIDYYYFTMSKMNEKMLLLQEEIEPRKNA